MVDVAMVRRAYREFLRREPENEDVINLHATANQSWEELVVSITQSAEYKTRMAEEAHPLGSDSPIASTTNSITQTFELLYGRAPSEAELASMTHHGVGTSVNWRQLARRIIACMNQHTATTSFSIRFKEPDLRRAALNGFSLMFDEADVAVGRHLERGGRYGSLTLQDFSNNTSPQK